jgi:phosphosulfolactate synthase
MQHLLTLPRRGNKPRERGITHVIDKGLGLRQVEDLLETGAEFIDIVKLGWGTGYITANLKDKLATYRSAGIPVCFGGTLLEVVLAQGKFDDFRRWLAVRSELAAGSWKVIGEARESGTVGLFRATGEVRSGLIDELLLNVDPNDMIFEAPRKPQQVWFIKQLGSEVNLGNITPEEVIPLETLRLGLRGDTLRLFHLNGWEQPQEPLPTYRTIGGE